MLSFIINCAENKCEMLLKHVPRFPHTATLATNMKAYSTTSTKKSTKVAILGASGNVGQPLALLLKHIPFISEMALYDRSKSLGVAVDLSHIDTPTQVKAYTREEQLHDCLKGMDVVVFAVGTPRKPGMTRDDLFDLSAPIVCNLSVACAQTCPEALIAVITNPVNSMVPLVSEVFKKKGVYQPERIFGVTTLDVIRANSFVSECKGLDVNEVEVPVIGGHSDETIIPLLCKTKPQVKWTMEEVETLSKRIQHAASEVIDAKANEGTSRLSMAYAAARFVYSLCRGLLGEPYIAECSYVRSDIVPHVKYFSTPLCLGPNGVRKNLGFSKLSKFEHELLETALPFLKKNIERGEDFVKHSCTTSDKPGEPEKPDTGKSNDPCKPYQPDDADKSNNKNSEKHDFNDLLKCK